jgi:two-component system, sensor histidine kinase and response regulator
MCERLLEPRQGWLRPVRTLPFKRPHAAYPPRRRHIEQTLEEGGFSVVVRHDGREGLRQTLETRPDLVLSDVLMPEMDGYGLCRAIRADGRVAQVPVVLMTSQTDPADVLRALAAGASGYVGKPFENEVLPSSSLGTSRP